MKTPAGRAQGFACFTAASPARAWAALTAPHETGGGYLYGMACRSTWQPGAPIDCRAVQSPASVLCALTGEVLHVVPPCRLSYILQSGPEGPAVYLTWQVRPCPGGSLVRLQIDEFECSDNDQEIEERWLPVMAALQALLARDVPASPGGSYAEGQ